MSHRPGGESLRGLSMSYDPGSYDPERLKLRFRDRRRGSQNGLAHGGTGFEGASLSLSSSWPYHHDGSCPSRGRPILAVRSSSILILSGVLPASQRARVIGVADSNDAAASTEPARAGISIIRTSVHPRFCRPPCRVRLPASGLPLPTFIDRLPRRQVHLDRWLRWRRKISGQVNGQVRGGSREVINLSVTSRRSGEVPAAASRARWAASEAARSANPRVESPVEFPQFTNISRWQ